LTRDGHEPVRRLFFALWPDETERQRLVQATAGAAGVSGGRLVPAESLHVTLAFLGSVPERRIPDLHPPARQVAKAFAQDARPPPLRFDRVAHWAGARILCALAADEARALALAAALRDTSAAAGFSPDLKPFPQALHAVLWRFDAFTLLDSHSAAAGPVYSVIESYPLFKTENARA
jgi:2'-5' RNA ligase